jgi:hypothetical protein
MRTLEQLTDAYVALDSRELSSRDGLLDIRSALSELATKVREFRAEVEAALVENIDLHGDIDMGNGKRLYVAVDKTYKCVNNAATLGAILEATGGDEALMAEHLASGAWKPGACRTTLGPRFDTLFETSEAKDVKTGSAKRIVKAFDPQFGGGA